MLNRLKLIWFALWYGRIRFTVTLVGRDQTKGYMQRWVFHVDQPSQDFKVLRAADMLRDPLTGDHYDAVVVDDIESPEDEFYGMGPVDPDIIDAVRDSPANLHDLENLTIRDVVEAVGLAPLHYLPDGGRDLSREERDALILKDWEKRQPK